jgi:hypothetical protein
MYLKTPKALTNALVQKQVRIFQYLKERNSKLIFKVLASEVKQLGLSVAVYYI